MRDFFAILGGLLGLLIVIGIYMLVTKIVHLFSGSKKEERKVEKNKSSNATSTADELPSEFAQRVSKPKPHYTLFYGISFAWAVAVLIGTLGFAIFGEDVGSIGLPAWQVFLGLAIIWLAASIKRLGPDELGAVLLWGKTMIPVRRGPKIVIVGIFQLERFRASRRNRQFPDDVEFIQRDDDKKALETVKVILPDGREIERQKVRPMRMTTAKPKTKEEGGDPEDILNVQMTVDFTFWVRWIIVDPFLYIVNTLGYDDASRAEMVEKQMRDTGETVLTILVSKRTPSQLISDMGVIQAELLTTFKKMAKGWGVEIDDLGLTSPDLSHDLATALRDIPMQKAKTVQQQAIADQVRISADAEAYRLEQEGKGLGAKKRLELTGEGQGYMEMAKILGIEGREALGAQVVRDTVGKGDLIVGMDGVKDVIALGKAVLGQGNKDSKKGGE